MAEGRLNCFLIDDDPEELVIFRMALEQLEFPVDCTYFKNPLLARSVQDAECCHEPDYIFLDLNIPAVAIGEEISKLLETFPYHETKLNIYSSYFPKVMLANLVETKNVGYFQKLPTIDQLAARLAEVFQS